MGDRREQRSMATSGSIARLVGDRGFGFIRDERGQELFFHATGVEGATFEELHEGQSVEFEREGDASRHCPAESRTRTSGAGGAALRGSLGSYQGLGDEGDA